MKPIDLQTSSPGGATNLWENQFTDLSHQLRQLDEDLLHISKKLIIIKSTLQQLHSSSSALAKKVHETHKRSIRSERVLEDLTNIVEHDHVYIFERLGKLEKTG